MSDKRVLLVEDDQQTSPLLEHVLISEGYTVDVAVTAKEAWKLLDEGRYALVIADWRLPDGDGTLIANAAANLGAKTLVMSGYLFNMPAQRAEGHEVLMKPVRPSELIATVERHIGKAVASG